MKASARRMLLAMPLLAGSLLMVEESFDACVVQAVPKALASGAMKL